MEQRYPNFEATLREHVAKWIEEQAEERKTYDPEISQREAEREVLEELMEGGCQSGIVGHLISYNDTVAFYKQYQSEIDGMIANMIEETGMKPEELFDIKWDEIDPFANDTQNQNLLAWFGFEEMARLIADERGYDV